MSIAVLSLSIVLAGYSPFAGGWQCASVSDNDPFQTDINVDSEKTGAKGMISNSSDSRLPNGPLKLWGTVEELKGSADSDLVPDLRLTGQVVNAAGDVSFSMLWDNRDGMSVNLRQYFKDGSRSKLLGAMTCEESDK